MSGQTILSAAYGANVQAEDDPLVQLAERTLDAISLAGRVGYYAVDSIPLLKYVPKWFPGARFQRDAEVFRKDILAMREVPFDMVKKSLVRYITPVEDFLLDISPGGRDCKAINSSKENTGASGRREMEHSRGRHSQRHRWYNVHR
jgi:hypothetical protein